MAWRGPSGTRSGPGVTTVTIVAIAVAAAAVAELGVIVLGPDDTGPEPVPVSAADWFDPTATAAARDYHQGQLVLFVIGFAVELAVLAALALGRPRSVRRLLRRLV